MTATMCVEYDLSRRRLTLRLLFIAHAGKSHTIRCHVALTLLATKAELRLVVVQHAYKKHARLSKKICRKFS